METCNKIESDVNEIIPNLWLGNLKSSYDKTFLLNHNIKYILRIMPDADPKYNLPHIKYITIPIKDDQICNINNFNDLFDKCADIIHNCIKNKTAILIHCKKGHHRSASFVAAYLIKYINISIDDVIVYINKIRPCALRRDCCITKKLYQYYNKLKNINCNYICKGGNILKCVCY